MAHHLERLDDDPLLGRSRSAAAAAASITTATATCNWLRRTRVYRSKARRRRCRNGYMGSHLCLSRVLVLVLVCAVVACVSAAESAPCVVPLLSNLSVRWCQTRLRRSSREVGGAHVCAAGTVCLCVCAA